MLGFAYRFNNFTAIGTTPCILKNRIRTILTPHSWTYLQDSRFTNTMNVACVERQGQLGPLFERALSCEEGNNWDRIIRTYACLSLPIIFPIRSPSCVNFSQQDGYRGDFATLASIWFHLEVKCKVAQRSCFQESLSGNVGCVRFLPMPLSGLERHPIFKQISG